MRSRKLAVLQSLLVPPPVYGDDTGDLLVVGWGSTKGAIEEAVDRAHAEGLKVSSVHLALSLAARARVEGYLLALPQGDGGRDQLQ